MSVYYYKISPISKHVFTMMPYTIDPTTLNSVPGKTQEVNLTNLNEAGLHRTLFILKTKVDPAKLGTAEEAWRKLPLSKTKDIDQELRKAYPENMLRILLSQFLEIWVLETTEKRNLGEIEQEKFKQTQSWAALHSVKPTNVGNSQLVMTQHGVQIQPEECAAKLRTLRMKINQLATDLSACNTTDTLCVDKVSQGLTNLNNAEKQSSCITSV